MTSAAGARTYSFHAGGPFRHALAWLHLVRADGRVRAAALALVVWVPLGVAELARRGLALAPDPVLRDLSVHVRLLVAMPMMLIAERLVDSACRSAIHSIYTGGFADRAMLDRIVDRGEQLRDAWWIEAALLAVSAIFLGIAGRAAFHGETGPATWTFARIWYLAIALPIAQFVMLRFAWRWIVWSILLVRLARLPLATLATHPDRAAGLSCVARPTSGFGGFAFAIGAILASAWGSQMLAHELTARSLLPELLVFLVAIIAVAIAPLLAFCGQLYRVRRRDLARYGDFAIAYDRAFHAKWIDAHRPADEALGTPDLQSLADLGNAYSVISSTRLFVFGWRHVLAVWASALVPMVPLFASLVTVEHVLRRIVTIVLGGIPL